MSGISLTLHRTSSRPQQAEEGQKHTQHGGKVSAHEPSLGAAAA